jgi:hypothetical protein
MKLKRNERSKDVKGYEGIYAVTTHGRVWSCKREIWLKPGIEGGGYNYVALCLFGKAKDKKIHRLVAEAFVENPDNKPQVNHKNGNKLDCRAINLEWVTARENLQHASDLGLNKTFKLSYADKVLICKAFSATKIRKNRLAKIFHVSPPAIGYIIKTYTPLVGHA